VIEVAGVSKVFRVPHQRRRSLGRWLVEGRYSYETFHALKDVSLRVASGEFVGLLGRNGSGKSTLIRVVAGIYPPSEGRVTVSGRVAPILELGVGFHGTLSVLDNVLLYGVVLGIPRRTLLADAADIVKAAGLERFADAHLENLSTGMKMRLGFVIALRAEAPILLIDEALAVGDEAFRERCLAELRRRRERGDTALFVSHETNLLEALCDRLVVIDQGSVRGEGTPAEMIALYRSLGR
jgi:ABC-type polysaccharide/polyol phosphate transport system ATPase subunit